MNYNLFNDILQTVIAISSLFIALLTYRISKKQSQLEQIMEANKGKPFLYPESLIPQKSTWVRFYKGGIELPTYIQSKSYENLTNEERKYLDDSISKHNKVYFTQLSGKLIIVLSKTKSLQSVLIEHNSELLTLRNYGTIITKFKINNIDVDYLDGSKAHFDGIENNYCSKIITDKIELIIDEAVNELDDLDCQITETEYNTLPNINFLEVGAPIFLKYKSYTVDISLWNQYNQKTNYIIKLDTIDNQLQPTVTEY